MPIISSSTLTCCHDDACQHFSPCVRGRKVVCQLTELIHNQARDRISQNLELHTRTHTQRQTEQQEAMHTCRHTNTSLCQICQLTKHVWCYPPLEHCVPVTVLASASNSTRSVETATSETRLTPWGIPNHLSSNAVWVLSDSYNLPSPSWQWITRQKKGRAKQTSKPEQQMLGDTPQRFKNRVQVMWELHKSSAHGHGSPSCSLFITNVMENDNKHEERWRLGDRKLRKLVPILLPCYFRVTRS